MIEKTAVIDMAIMVSCIIVLIAIIAPLMFPAPDIGEGEPSTIGTLKDKVYIFYPFPHYLLVIETEDETYEIRGNMADYGYLEIGDTIDLRDL